MKAIVTVLLASLVSVSWAPARASADETPQRSDCQLRVATGKKGKAFSRLLRDIRSVCGSQLQLCEVESEGGLANSNALATNEADLGFVQIDTLLAMRQSDENIAALQSVVPVNANLLHILARREGYTVRGERSLSSLFLREDKTIVASKLSELKGLPIGVVGSAQHLGRALERSFSYGWRFSDFGSDEQALAALKAGEIAAVFTMSGWPHGSIEALARESGSVLIAYDLPVQAPYQLVRKSYPKLGVFTFAFLAAPNLLVTRPFKPEGERGHDVAALQQCIVSHLDALREGRFEPGWKEIKDPNETYGWPRFSARVEATAKR